MGECVAWTQDGSHNWVTWGKHNVLEDHETRSRCRRVRGIGVDLISSWQEHSGSFDGMDQPDVVPRRMCLWYSDSRKSRLSILASQHNIPDWCAQQRYIVIRRIRPTGLWQPRWPSKCRLGTHVWSRMVAHLVWQSSTVILSLSEKLPYCRLPVPDTVLVPKYRAQVIPARSRDRPE